jgi:DNA-binding NtrC family response regulator
VLEASPAKGLPSGPLQLSDLEHHAILQALDRTGGQVQRAAQLLGISRRTLSRKLKVYRMEKEETYYS